MNSLNMADNNIRNFEPFEASREYVQRPFLAFPPDEIGTAVLIDRVALLAHKINNRVFKYSLTSQSTREKQTSSSAIAERPRCRVG